MKQSSDPMVEVNLNVLRDLQRDARRYRYLRDEDNWGEDSGEDCWELLGEATGEVFDGIVDSRQKAQDINQ